MDSVTRGNRHVDSLKTSTVCEEMGEMCLTGGSLASPSPSIMKRTNFVTKETNKQGKQMVQSMMSQLGNL